MVSKDLRKYFFCENFEMRFFEAIGYPFLRSIFLFCDFPAKNSRDPKILSCLTENSYIVHRLFIEYTPVKRCLRKVFPTNLEKCRKIKHAKSP